MNANAPITVTMGEPAGIGPDLCVRLAERRWGAGLMGIGDIEVLRDRARRLRAGVRIVPYIRGRDAAPGTFEVAHFPLAVPAVPGRLDPGNAKAVLATLDAALNGCLAGEFSAMVTAPVQKSVINDAGMAFSGHTEFLAERTGATVVMMLVGATATGPLRVALTTTHLPLSAVPAAITEALVTRTVRIVADELSAKFRIANPRIAVCGLNPHAGEDGYLGREEIEIIAPALAALREQGIAVAGPLPADTVFVPHKASEFDCVIAMYHDQGLPVLKHASFGHGVNPPPRVPVVAPSGEPGPALRPGPRGAGPPGPGSGLLFAAVALAIELTNRAHDPRVTRM